MTNKSIDKKSHWENIYKTKNPKKVSWFKTHLSESLRLIRQTGIQKGAPIIDVGGGASTLVDDLLMDGFTNITVLDVSSQSLGVSKKRLGREAQKIQWIAADITQAVLPQNHYALWHDRAVFHFLTKVQDRERYKETLTTSLKPGGFVVISTFSLKGPLTCSGLDVARYSSETLSNELGPHFKLLDSLDEDHKTPFKTVQNFTYCLFQNL